MLGLGRKKIPLSLPVITFVERVEADIRKNLPEIRSIILRHDEGSGNINDGQLYFEVLTASTSVGIRSVENLYNPKVFCRVRDEVREIFKEFGEQNGGSMLARRFDEYVQIWEESKSVNERGNLPWDNVTGCLLEELDICKRNTLGEDYISPSAIMELSAFIVILSGEYWKIVKQQFKLVA